MDISIQDFLNNVNNIVVPDGSNFEIEARILIDGRKKYQFPYKSYTPEQTVDIAKKIINKYKDSTKIINQTVNFLKEEHVKQLVFVKGEQKKDKQVHYKKVSLVHPLFMFSDDYPAYRLAFTFEVPIDEFSIKDATSARIRLRYSITLDNWQLDITLIKSITDLTNPNNLKIEKNNMLFDIDIDNFIDKAPWNNADYIEFEMEYIGDHLNFSVKDLNVIDTIFDDVIEKPKATNISTYQNIIYQVAKYIKPKHADRFKTTDGLKQLSNQVIELNKNMYLKDVAKNITDYYITDKVDGKRAVIYITNDKSGKTITYSITDSLSELDINSSITSTVILDTEFYEGKYYIFDVMVWEDDVITNLPFNERLKYFEKAEKISELFRLKPFVKLTNEYKSQIERFKKEKKKYDIDGIVLTPANGLYDTMKVYKYKPMEKMSIDFLIKKCPDKLLGISPYVQETGSMLYLLFCGISYNMYNKLNMRVIKHYEEIFNTIDPRHFPKYFPIQFQPSNKTYAYLFWSDNDKLDNEVGEFIYDINENIWKLHKIREDRRIELTRGNYYGNNYKIAESTWMSYTDPLIIEDLSSDADNIYFQEHDNRLQKASRNFNSFVKSKIFEQYKNTDWVMDMASGKGQDLFRYGTYGIRNIIFLEIDKAALLELLSRKYEYSEDISSNKMNIMLHQLDLNDDYKSNINILEDIHIPITGVDLIVCNFAFHYFIADKKHLVNIIKFISYYLKPGGRFVFTAFDGKEIIKLLNENNGNWTIVSTDEKEIKYSIKKQYKINVLEPIGQKIDVLLPFSKNQYYSEYLVNIEYISSEFASYDMTLETDQSFREYFDEYRRTNRRGFESMDVDDKTYVGLYHYYCFYKSRNDTNKKSTGGRIRKQNKVK